MMQHMFSIFRRPHAVESSSSEASPRAVIVLIEQDPEIVASVRTAVSRMKPPGELIVAGEPDIDQVSSHSPALILLNMEAGGSDVTLIRQLLTEHRLLPTPIVLLVRLPDAPNPSAEALDFFDGRIDLPVDEKTLPARIQEFVDGPANKKGKTEVHIPALGASDHGGAAVDLLTCIENNLPDSQFSFAARNAIVQMTQTAKHLEHRELASYLEQAESLSNAGTARARYCFRSVLRSCVNMVTDQSDLIPGLADLRKTYLDNRYLDTPDLDRLLDDRDFAALRTAGHNLKGSGGAYGFSDLTEIGRSIETAAKNSDESGIRVLLDRLAIYISALRPAAAASKKEELHGTGIPIVRSAN